MLENVVFTKDISGKVDQWLKENTYDKLAILVDENTQKHCLPLLKGGQDFEIILIKSGEEHKHLETCQYIWNQLTEFGFSRKSILINLGGGVITDMGGFVASTYKRGIRFINVPTTLLAQVDASIGGKTGVDFQGFKNHIGVFSEPEIVILDTKFLETLPERELRSGFAEILKHGLIADRDYWTSTTTQSFDHIKSWDLALKQSVKIKAEVVTEDPAEKGLRKILNFGHTLGHAIETYYLDTPSKLLHGEAIAVGMILEAHLSHQVNELPVGQLNLITDYIKQNYKMVAIPAISDLLRLMGQDKKNEGNRINFSLLVEIGKCGYNDSVDSDQIKTAIDYYNNLYK